MTDRIEKVPIRPDQLKSIPDKETVVDRRNDVHLPLERKSGALDEEKGVNHTETVPNFSLSNTCSCC